MFTPPNVSRVTCHMSCVTCHMLRVTCHMSRVTCHVSLFLFFSFFLRTKWWSLSVEGLSSTGLPRLVFSTAPASPGLLIILTGSLNCHSLPSPFSPIVFAARQQHAADYLLLDIWPSLVWQEQLAALCQHSGVCCLLSDTSVIVLLRPDDCEGTS